MVYRELRQGWASAALPRNRVNVNHPGPFVVVASSWKRQTKVGTLACFDFL